MKVIKKAIAFTFFVSAVLWHQGLSAQMLGEEAVERKQVVSTPNSSQPQQTTPTEADELFGIEPVFVPEPAVSQAKRPTLDGVKRGTVYVNPILTEDPDAVKDDELIYLFYKDFSVTRSINNRVRCSVTFVVLTALNRKLSNLSVRLQWPDMTTAVSFDDVSPNTPTSYTYDLVGDGCFSMDKKPNIIVNRCRVKDISQQQCAAKIRWLSK